MQNKLPANKYTFVRSCVPTNWLFACAYLALGSVTGGIGREVCGPTPRTLSHRCRRSWKQGADCELTSQCADAPRPRAVSPLSVKSALNNLTGRQWLRFGKQGDGFNFISFPQNISSEWKLFHLFLPNSLLLLFFSHSLLISFLPTWMVNGQVDLSSMELLKVERKKPSRDFFPPHTLSPYKVQQD